MFQICLVFFLSVTRELWRWRFFSPFAFLLLPLLFSFDFHHQKKKKERKLLPIQYPRHTYIRTHIKMDMRTLLLPFPSPSATLPPSTPPLLPPPIRIQPRNPPRQFGTVKTICTNPPSLTIIPENDNGLLTAMAVGFSKEQLRGFLERFAQGGENKRRVSFVVKGGEGRELVVGDVRVEEGEGEVGGMEGEGGEEGGKEKGKGRREGGVSGDLFFFFFLVHGW